MYKDKGYRFEPCSNSKNHRLPFELDLRVFVYDDINRFDLDLIKEDKLNFTPGGEFLVLIHNDAVIGIVGWKYEIINDIIFLQYNAGWVHPKYRHMGVYNYLFAQRECLVSETFDVPFKHFFTFATLSSLPTFLIRNDFYKEKEIAYARIH